MKKIWGAFKMKWDWVIVGAGLAGCTLAERISNELDQSVLIVEKRDHIGGNLFDHYDEHGLLIHKYGPHIFHTNSRKVWDYLSQFTTWLPYFHKVLGCIEGTRVPIPFNFNSIQALFPHEYARKLENSLLKEYSLGDKIPIFQLLDSDVKEIQTLAQYIYNKVYEGYTKKQWNLNPEQLDKSVTGRVPFFVSRNNCYFQDTYQGVPLNGYTNMIKKMVENPKVKILLKADYKEVIKSIKYTRMVYTGTIDYFFDYKFGHLPYRSLNFEYKHYSSESYQEAAQVNFPNEYNFTRITEYKKITGQHSKGTTISLEYPIEYLKEINEPYYPIPKTENKDLYRKYNLEAEKLKEKVIFLGRLAEYKYFNMDQIVGRALSVFERDIFNKKQ
ncbi:UDP-galactopyranose mutase [Pseudalkalibacillus hwajinpoensis]|uniref:UDP-galactopyranose mutase n=1 Tax=Guptibacillus hwajinpoensis TaxID=208199 RepID=UPI00325BF2C9